MNNPEPINSEEADPCKMTDEQYEEHIYGPNRVPWPINSVSPASTKEEK